jgi:hypothetical protein
MSAISTKLIQARDEIILHETASDSRCRHRTPSGRRCERQSSLVNYGFCAAHAHEGQKFRDADATAIAAELLGPESNFGDPAVVNQVLGKLFTLVAQGRIPVSTAALLAQIGQLLVQGLQGSHGDVRLSEVNNAWRQTIVNVLNSADRDSQNAQATSSKYEDLGRRIEESRAEDSKDNGVTGEIFGEK